MSSRQQLVLTLALAFLLARVLSFASDQVDTTPLRAQLDAALLPVHSAYQSQVQPALRKAAELFQGTPGAGEDEEDEGDLAEQLDKVVWTKVEVVDPVLPICERTALIRLHGTRGFASEITRMIRNVALAEAKGYTVFVEAQGWMYGSWEDYFTHHTYNCTRNGTPAWRNRPGMNPSRLDFEVGTEELDSPAWAREPHVADGMSRDYISALFLHLFTNQSRLARLHTLEINAYPPPLPLDGGETVPSDLYDAFKVQADIVERWWKLNPKTRAMVDALRGGLGWDEEERDVVGMHVRLGDKVCEINSVKLSPLRFATRAQLAAHRQYIPHASCSNMSALAPTSITPTMANTYLKAISHALYNSPTSDGSLLAEPVVAIMSDDSSALAQLRAAGKANVGNEEEDEGTAEMLMLEEVAQGVEGASGERSGKDAEQMDGFNSHSFADLPMQERVYRTRTMIRDLTLLGERADSLVLTASSNVGRLLALLGGLDMAKAGRIYSCDVRWFPTAYYS